MDRSGSFSPGPGAGNGRNTKGEAGPEGSAFSGSAALVENAIVSLAIAARIAGIPADPESLCRAFPSRASWSNAISFAISGPTSR